MVLWLNFSGVLLALVQVRLSGYAASFGGCCVGLVLTRQSTRTACSRRLLWFVSTCPWSCLFHTRKNLVFIVASFSKVVFAFGFVPGTFGFVLALVQAHFSGYAAGFGHAITHKSPPR